MQEEEEKEEEEDEEKEKESSLMVRRFGTSPCPEAFCSSGV